MKMEPEGTGRTTNAKLVPQSCTQVTSWGLRWSLSSGGLMLGTGWTEGSSFLKGRATKDDL